MHLDLIKLAELVLTGKASDEQEVAFYERLQDRD